MNKLLLLAFGACLMFAGRAYTQDAPSAQIKWLTFEEAEKMVAKSPRKIMVDMYTPWCGPCKMMMTYTFSDAAFVEYVNANYYAVKFNAESGDPVKFNGRDFLNPEFDPERSPNARNSAHQLTRALQITGYPTVVVFNEKLEVMDKLAGFRPADTLLPLLQNLNK